MLGDASQDIGEPSLRINIVHFGGNDEAVHHRGALAAAIRAAEQPRLPTQSDATHASLGGIVGQADATIVEEARERGPTLEHVVHGLGDVVAARELGALLSHPGLQIGDQRRAEFLSDGPALFKALPVDRPSISNNSSIRRTASSASGEIMAGFSPCALRRAFSARSAITKNGRRALTPQAASRIGPGARPPS